MFIIILNKCLDILYELIYNNSMVKERNLNDLIEEKENEKLNDSNQPPDKRFHRDL